MAARPIVFCASWDCVKTKNTQLIVLLATECLISSGVWEKTGKMGGMGEGPIHSFLGFI